MVSFWPWKGDDTSPASFERTLSTLSAKITKSQQVLDQLRQRSRRLKALWTLYTSFAYLLCAITLGLVVGWKNWGPWEYSAIAGSPLTIYLVRTAIATYYTYRIDGVTYRLEELQGERIKTIDKLKTATKYDSTQELLEKYGGASPQPSPKPKGQPGQKGQHRKTPKQPQRTGMGPPATANIPQNQPTVSQPAVNPPISPHITLQRPPPSTPDSPYSSSRVGPPEFAPNAFPSVPQYDRSSESITEGKWYDRILDLLLGEDETSPRNRIVLICKTCRLVNGQAPPGVKRIEEVGKWRCIGCGGWNGEVDEGAKIVGEMKKRIEKETLDSFEVAESEVNNVHSTSEAEVNDSDGKELEGEEKEEVSEEPDSEEEPTRKTRSGQRSSTKRTKS